VLSVHSGASAALLAAWEKALPHGPDDQVVEWNECGHFLHQERPDEFAALARSWLAGLS
jgi:pimeloyl-ACP methyl ester carboxylesterase